MEEINRAPINPWLTGFGIAFLVYAILGNYVALPGYVRFLERGGVSPEGNSFDLAVLVGATKTILWMYSFQLGVLALAVAHSLREGLHTRYFVGLGLVWMALWSWPSLSAPGPWFYIVFGGIIISAIVCRLLMPSAAMGGRLSESLLLGSILFFAIATWEVCGLGSTGRMLHPEQSSQPLAHNILVTQSTKLMLEFVLAWCLLVAGLVVGGRAGDAP